jgi:hypothetical protein
MKLPFTDAPQCATRSASMKSGGGFSQPSKVRTATLRWIIYRVGEPGEWLPSVKGSLSSHAKNVRKCRCDLLLQTRTRALDGTLRPLFEKWYPGLSNDNSAETAQAEAA